MRPCVLLSLLASTAATMVIACATSNGGSSSWDPPGQGGTGGTGGAGGTAGTGAGGSAGEGGLFQDDGGTGTDAPPLSDDAACASTASEATVEKLPVDIIWVVDNSSSMQPAITEIKKGLNAFASLIAAKNLDYKVIMLSLRNKTSPVQVGGSTRYPICIPAPLAGNDSCGNGPRFFHSSVDIRSVQPLEQFLGTLGQTDGYKLGDERGGEPWKQELRPQATKTIVIVSDDNSRLSATNFESFAGGKNPANSLTLPPGILSPSWNGLFTDYVFSGIYGWGSTSNPNTICEYSDGSAPPSSGPTYTTLVQKTGGVRAQLCDGSAAWQPFFDAVAQAVDQTAKLSCELTIPKPPTGEDLDPELVNVALSSGGAPTYLPRVNGAAACSGGGWYYDDPAAPQKVILCETSCDQAQALVGEDKTGKIEVFFGCQSIIK
ncbi:MULTISPECIES: hypothetical protein [Polyangium]|uniref:VWA domain-containing protein n=2 Tax=Polyangium TaxID=55 RepID=A0A4U1JIZ7_9BACT|nr:MULTISPECIES: hypothetical protein [Polyangium]MDI1433031.1 hypothetical protein [Polyangium sorediatum]TKD12649.1 hypothetical protein E8A74_02535 [Polyangium fumosum]